MRFGYGTNGFTGHRLEDALTILAEEGYSGVALTLDHPHVDPFAADLPRQLDRIGCRLADLGLAVVIETGGRYVLDIRRKHHPTLVSAEGRELRVRYLQVAVRAAEQLGAQAMSFWSGTLPEGTPAQEGWSRLTEAVTPVLEQAEHRGVTCAMEPEPGMFVDTVDGVLELRHRLGSPEPLRVTLDLGHIVCNEPRDVRGTVRAAGALLANVQLDDMVPGIHEHLPLGQGQLDLAAALAALAEVGYAGLVSLELPRHSHVAPALARESLAVLHRHRPPGP